MIRPKTKPRNQNPFTERRIKLITATIARIKEIDNPTDVLTRDSYSWSVKSGGKFGKLPKLNFEKDTTRIKAEIMQSAGLTDSVSKGRKDRIDQIRDSKNIPRLKCKSDNVILADRFDKEWDEIMFAFKKAVFTSGYLNRIFTNPKEPLSTPAKLMQSIVKEEYCGMIGNKER